MAFNSRFCSRFWLALLIAPLQALGGQADFSTGFALRSVPFGAAAIAEAGYNVLLWGRREKVGDFQYGYLRASARYAGTGVVNRGDATLTLSPVAPLVLDLGATARLRLIEHFPTAECEGLQCSGLLTGTFARARAVLGAGPVFGMAVATLEKLVPQEADGPFWDEQNALAGGDGAGGRQGDLRREQVWIAGLRLSDRWSGGYLHQASQMLGAGTSTRQDSLFVNHLYRPEVLVMAGAGWFGSSTYDGGLTVFARVRFTGPGSLELN
jgi:hypothetical protein